MHFSRHRYAAEAFEKFKKYWELALTVASITTLSNSQNSDKSVFDILKLGPGIHKGRVQNGPCTPIEWPPKLLISFDRSL